jgi:hypothetical protein
MINHVIFAAATDEARPILTGVLAKIEGGQVTLAAADGFRLSLRTAHLSTPNAEPIQAIIPARALAELGRVITAEEPVFMSLPPGRGQVIFHHDSVELVSQLIEGAFPDYNNVVPKNYTTRTVMSTAEFRKACKTSDIFAREAAHAGARHDLRDGRRDRRQRDRAGRHRGRRPDRDRLQRQISGGRAQRDGHAQRGVGNLHLFQPRRHPACGAG